MRRLFNYSTVWLWLLIGWVALLLGGRALGIQWPFSPKVGFGRLLLHPEIASLEMALAAILLLLVWWNGVRRKWMIIGVAAFAAGCALYDMFCYLIGVEFLLLYGALSLIRENVKDA